jgi:hypothetical protein
VPFRFFCICISPVLIYKILNPKKIPANFFLFIAVENNGLRGDNMPKSHYSVKKRNKELARKLKQERKRQRKLDKDSIKPEDASDQSQNNVNNQIT